MIRLMAGFSRPFTFVAFSMLCIGGCAGDDTGNNDASGTGGVDEAATMASDWTIDGSVLDGLVDFGGAVTCEESQAFRGDILCDLNHTYPLESCGVNYSGRMSWSEDLNAWEGQLQNADTDATFYEDVDDITIYVRLTAIGSQTDTLAFYAYFDTTNEEADNASLCNSIREGGVTGDLKRVVD